MRRRSQHGRPPKATSKAAAHCALASPSIYGVKAFRRLRSLPVSVALLDSSGLIVSVNQAWRSLGRQYGLRLPNFGVGSNYLNYCPSEDAGSRRFVRYFRMLLAGRLDLLTLVYPCHSRTEKRWFSLIGVPLSPGSSSGVALLHINLTPVLPLATGSHRSQGKAAEIQNDASRHNIQSIGELLQHSASEAISSQLSSMVRHVHRELQEKQSSARPKAQGMSAKAQLTRRQIEILQMLGAGKTNKEIAMALSRSPNTIKLHVSAILRRLKLKSRTQAALALSSLPGARPAQAIGRDLMSWKQRVTTKTPGSGHRRTT